MDSEEQVYERATIPDDRYRTAVAVVLGVHAQPVWCWGERDLYATKVMDGPGLATWVLTAGLWAEAERRAWDWEQLVAGVGPSGSESLVTGAGDVLCRRTVASVDGWVDLMLLAACVDGVGEELASTLRGSTYGPLRRHAGTLAMFKRAQSADGCVAVRTALRDHGLPPTAVDDALPQWLDLARRHVSAVADAEARAGWVDLGIATPLDAALALRRVEARLQSQLEGTGVATIVAPSP